MQGRAHLYEGHAVDAAVHGARTMARLGARCVLLTNAAGGLEPAWAPGDLMVLSDHLNLTGQSPLVGPNDEALGPRFVDMTRAYDAELAAHAPRGGEGGVDPAALRRVRGAPGPVLRDAGRRCGCSGRSGRTP